MADINNGRIVKRSHFDGDIIITDPCYIHKYEERDDGRCDDYFEDAIRKNHMNAIYADTIIGDWGCTTWRMYDGGVDKVDRIGEFCADGAMVAVFQLDEVLDYNKGFDYHVERPWTTTLIENFTGEVSIREYIDEYDSRTRYVYGISDDGKFEFITSQTSL